MKTELIDEQGNLISPEELQKELNASRGKEVLECWCGLNILQTERKGAPL